MVDKVADKAALFLWHALHWLSVLLLVLLVVAVIAGVLPPEVPTASGGAAPEATQCTAMDVARGPVASGGDPAALDSRPDSLPATFTPAPASPTPTWTAVVPSLPHAGQVSARANAEAVLALASQGRWLGPRATATPTATLTPLIPPSPTPTALPLPTESMRPPTQPPTRIVAPSIGLDAKIVPVKWVKIREGGRAVLTWQVPKNKAGWHFTSALPGQPGNTVLSGHRNIYSEVFRYIVDLKPGDPITLYAGDEPFVYYVEEQHIVQEVGVPESVREENARWIARTDDVRLTLITCAPYEAPGNTHRVIVVARP